MTVEKGSKVQKAMTVPSNAGQGAKAETSQSVFLVSLYIGVTVAILIVVIIALLAMSFLHAEAEKRVVATTQNMALSLEQTIESVLASVDVALQASADEISRQMDAGKVDSQSVNKLLIRQQQRVPLISYIRGTNARGDIVYGPDVAAMRASKSGDEDFIALSSNPSNKLFIGRASLAHIEKRWQWVFSRPVFKPDGSFGGVVYAGILIDQIDRLFAKLSMESGDVATIRNTDLAVVTRYTFGTTNPIPYGDKTISIPFVAALKANPNEGTYTSGGTSVDGITRTQSYRLNSQYGFIVNVGIARERALAQWRSQALIVGALVAAFIIATLVFAAITHRGWQRKEREIVERKRAEIEVNATKNQLHAMLEGIPIPFFVKDAQSRILMMNKACEAQWGASFEELKGTDSSHFFPHDQMKDFLAQDRQAFEHGVGFDFEDEVWSAAYQGNRTVHTYKNPTFDDAGQPLYLVCATIDITERKQAELALQSSLKDKVALLNEVHHRVKNNLQVITSLLRLEARRSAQPETDKVLKEMQGRIRSMALLHESLYRSGIFASVDLATYLNQLAVAAFRSQVVSEGRVRLSLDLVSQKMGMDQALPCGLLINELITNCFKHGFPDDAVGEIRIELKPVEGSKLVCMSVVDTGAGLPADFESRKEQSLGLQLVSDLADQIGGRLETVSNPGAGARFSVTFMVKDIVS